jgi:alternate signal-mediated exported protein
MKRSTKGAIAAGGAAVLLMGGAGTLAYWTATGTVDGGSFTSGELKLLNEDCDGAGGGTGTGWFFDSGEVTNGKEYAAGDLLVPGDVLSKTCTFDIKATGEHLRATLAATGGTDSGALAASLTPSAAFIVDGGAVTEITEGNDGDVLSATVSVTFDPAANNTTQNISGVLADYVVTLTQAHN